MSLLPGLAQFEGVVLPSSNTGQTHPLKMHITPRRTVRRVPKSFSSDLTSASAPIAIPEAAIASGSRRDHISVPSPAPATVTDSNGGDTAHSLSSTLPFVPPYQHPLPRTGTPFLYCDCSAHPKLESR